MTSRKRMSICAAMVVVLLSVSAAAATPACYPGAYIPHNPLQGCNTYVVSKTCGVGPRLPTRVMKERCCRELSEILGMCQCEAIRILLDGVVPPGGVFEGGLIRDRPGCPREAQRKLAAALTGPEECDLGGPCFGLA